MRLRPGSPAGSLRRRGGRAAPVALLLLACCPWQGCRAPDDPPPPRQSLLREPLDAAALAALEALRASAQATVLDVDFSQRSTAPLPDMSWYRPWRRTDAGLELTTIEPSALQWVTVRPPKPLATAVTIEITAPAGPDPVPLPDRILWRTVGQPRFQVLFSVPRQDLPRSGGQPARAAYHVPEPREPIEEIRLDYVNLWAVPSFRRLVVREDPLSRLLTTEEGDLWGEIAGMAMPAAIATAGEPRVRRVRVPEGGRLELSLARILPAGSTPSSAVRFEVSVAGGSSALLSRTVEPDAPEAWLPAEVDLEPLAGREVDLQFVVSFDGDGKRPVALWGAPAIVSTGEAPGEVVILAVWDTTRRDLLSLYGHERPTTPFLEEMGRDAAVFERAYSQSSWTIPSMGSLLTGMHPWQLGLAWARSHHLPRSAITLAEAMSREGYLCGAVVGNPVLAIQEGYAQGFDWYRPAHDSMVDGERLTQDALAWAARQRDRGMLLYVHYVDPHAPYRIWPAELEALFPGDDPEELEGPRFPPRTPEEARVLRARYEGELRRTDAHLRRLVEGVRRLTGKEPLVVLASDHGEDFLEWGFYGHGANLHDTQTRVPLMFRWPGRVPAGRIDDTVQNVDVVPTLLELLDVRPIEDVAGSSLLPVLRGDAGSRVAYGETNAHGRRRAFAEADGFKYMTYQRYDPLEQVPPGALPDIAARLDAHLAPVALYDTSQGDEAIDVSADHPEAVRRLQRTIAEVEIRRHGGIGLRVRAPRANEDVFRLVGELIVETGPLGAARGHGIEAVDELALEPEEQRSVRFSLELPAGDEDWILVSPPDPAAKLRLVLQPPAGAEGVVLLGGTERPGAAALEFDRRTAALEPAEVIGSLDRHPDQLLIQVWAAPQREGAPATGLDEKERARLRALGYVQ